MRKGGSVSVRRAGRQAVAAVACCCVLLLTAYAQTGAQEEKQNAAALELKLSAYEASVCQGSSLTLSLEITNTSERQLKVLKSDLWRAFSYFKVGQSRGGAEVSCGGGDGTEGGWIVLEPGDKYSDTLAYGFNGRSFFKEAGRYKIATNLSYYIADRQAKTALSNGAEFEIEDCAAK